MKDLLLKLYIQAQRLREEHGQDMVEYALVVGIIALAATAGMQKVANGVNGMWNAVSTSVTAQTAKIPTT